MTVLLSLQPQVITDSSGLPTRDFRNWQLAVTNAVNAPADVAPVPPVPPVSGDYLPLSTFVRGVDGIAWTGTLETGGVLLSLETVADSGAGALRGITRDSFGRVTGTTNATITGTAGQITVANGDAVAGVPTLALANTAVTPGSYTNTNLTVDAQGRITAAANGVSGGGGMTLVGTATVTGSAATTLTLSGLDLATDKCYRVLFACKNATGSSSNVSLYYSGDTTAVNYVRQTIQYNNTTITGARANDGFGFSMVASGPATGDMEILLDFDGRARAFIRNSLGAAGTIQIHDVRHVRDVVGNVTSITLSASVANSLAVGSYFKVFKLG